MTSRIAPAFICKIIAPAHPAARGKTVTVLRLAVGCPDLDGVVFTRLSEDQVVWVVKSLGAAIPWGDEAVKVFAIGEECLSLHARQDGNRVMSAAELMPVGLIA